MEEVPHLNIDELYETKQKSDCNRVQIYNKLLTRIHKKIKTASRQHIQNEFCYFVMPEILIGYTNYNLEECLMYIISCLKDDGFLVKYIHPRLLIISWHHWIPKYVRDEIKKKTGKIIDKFGNEIIKTTPNKPFDDINKNPSITSKQNKINTNYKPTGKFVYGNDLLKSIKDTL
jgi:hypothetical protein